MAQGKFEAGRISTKHISPSGAPATAIRPRPQKKSRAEIIFENLMRFLVRTGKRIRYKFLRSRKKKKPRYVRRLWDVRLWAPGIIAFSVLLNIAIPNRKAAPDAEEVLISADTIASPVSIVENIPEETEGPTLNPDAVSLAILADTVAARGSDEVKKIIMWIVINRVEDTSHGYGGTLQEEISRPKQWQSYDPNSYYLEHTYDLAVEVLDAWNNNEARPIYNDMLWFRLNRDNSITIRNQFSADKNRVEQTFK